MLGKLLKYELMATARIFLPLYIGLMVMAVFSGLSFRTELGIMVGLAGFMIFIIYTALVVITIILLIQRFYQNFLRDEGYLMFTLPVTPSTLISSKLIVTCFWCLASIIVGALAAFVIAVTMVPMSDIVFVLGFVDLSFISSHMSTIILFILACITQLVFGVLHVYLSLAIGQLPPFGKHRILAAVAAYIVISIVLQIVVSVILVIFGISFYQNPMFNTFYAWTNFMNVFLIGSMVFNLILAAGAFIGTSLILQKKLNLE